MNTTKPKSSKITAGSIDTEHVSLNLLRANDFVAQKIREQLKDILVIVLFATLANADDWVEIALFRMSISIAFRLSRTDRDVVSISGDGEVDVSFRKRNNSRRRLACPCGSAREPQSLS